jgi:transcriptional regulator with XRE-family HTH domain
MHLIREFREDFGWDMMELSRRSGVSHRLICKLNTNPDQNLKMDTMVRFSDAFNVPPSILFFPDRETQKRKVMTAMVEACCDICGITKDEFYEMMQDIVTRKPSLNTLPSHDAVVRAYVGKQDAPPFRRPAPSIHSLQEIAPT